MKKSQILFPLIISLCISAQGLICNNAVDKAYPLAIQTLCKTDLVDSMYLLKVLTEYISSLGLMCLTL